MEVSAEPGLLLAGKICFRYAPLPSENKFFIFALQWEIWGP